VRFARLEIWEMATDNDHALTHAFDYVDARYENGRASATRGDVLLAELGTYDDDPVTIDGAAIVIDGLAVLPAPSLKHSYAYWRLTPRE